MSKNLVLVLSFLLSVSGFVRAEDETICDEVSQYKGKITNNLDSYDVFSDLVDAGEIYIPNGQEMHPSVGLKLLIQGGTYRMPVDISRWKKKIEDLEGIMKTMRVKKFKADMNNNGDMEDVVQVAWKGDEVLKGVWIKINYVVDEFNNIRSDFVNDGTVEYISGDVISYKDMFYTVKAYGYGRPAVEVNELSTKPIISENKPDGFFKGLTVCKISL
ncbi:hypothetical protein Q2E61_14505 [Microbulbifer thermotolerans]|uniref:hypothetical protein n=1 Tax=Microbulbifer thermotolerans TaxID=252514 RepID=UPI002672B618|nr:hypothetical protein [Microbulbifer thermotolerans]WKT60105.1 hypothetical protein Q2E61_14505 [Microbulbifer thermotolerans]